jgi:hypothetical protein
MADRNSREKLENDADRDMSHVPGTYNPGNQAGKDVRGDGVHPESSLGKREGETGTWSGQLKKLLRKIRR